MRKLKLQMQLSADGFVARRELEQTTSFDCGLVVLKYTPAN